jgi:exopolyphosphatase/guanosine-5'-triphosphate,3'-diphosphate pyrophosphatase
MENKKTHYYGVIDIGSNSVRFVVYEIFGSAFTPIFSEKVLAGLGRDLHRTGLLHPGGVALAFAALKRFKMLAQARGLTDVLIAATAALRDAGDAQEFIERVHNDIGFDISPLSGTQEAYISAMGVLSGDRRSSGVAADLGGASLELTQIQEGQVEAGKSFPLGPFSLFKTNFEPMRLRGEITSQLAGSPLSGFDRRQSLYLIGGAWRNLAIIHQKRVQYPLRVAQNYRLDIREAQALARWAWSEDGQEELLMWRGLSARRAETLPYSGLLLDVLIEHLQPKDIVIAPGGLRDGMIYDALPDTVKTTPALFDACEVLVNNGAAGRDFGASLHSFLTAFDGAWPPAFEWKNENRLRKAACLLVGIGKGMNPDHKAKMVFQTVLYAPLPGVTHSERAYLTLMLFASFTEKTTTPNDAALQRFLSDEEQHAARLYGQAMRTAVKLSGRSCNTLNMLSLECGDNRIKLKVKAGHEDLIDERCAAYLAAFSDTLGYKFHP